ncbi:MAG: PepSY domain-containing protein [Roseibium sp.]|uniref:PepSY domain-containing protein n=1 Tax=Roseibium sp. TaxID=1936156 RepID=UPI001B0D2EA5|nr:PepSY domain-containing protein [Roseibium sp.]MBO6891484.1 PepSY domain-containing protein [Roseibium sp.]MBO6931326.1 PepSY domain-containing protein [Roseibium sp.]
MEKKVIVGSVIAGLLVSMGAMGAATAQSATTPVAMSEEKAIEIALAEVPGTVQETELEKEDGKQVYEIEILTADGVEMEVEIDVATGTVLEVEADDDGDDDHDGKDDDDKATK